MSYCDDQTTRELIDDSICHINTRFRTLKENSLALVTLCDFHKWPLGSQELGSLRKYSETKDLVCGHLDQFFLPGEREEIPVGGVCSSFLCVPCEQIHL